MPTASSNVRVRGQSGKHLLVLSSSQFVTESGHGEFKIEGRIYASSCKIGLCLSRLAKKTLRAAKGETCNDTVHEVVSGSHHRHADDNRCNWIGGRCGA